MYKVWNSEQRTNLKTGITIYFIIGSGTPFGFHYIFHTVPCPTGAHPNFFWGVQKNQKLIFESQKWSLGLGDWTHVDWGLGPRRYQQSLLPAIYSQNSSYRHKQRSCLRTRSLDDHCSKIHLPFKRRNTLVETREPNPLPHTSGMYVKKGNLGGTNFSKGFP